MRSEFMKDSTVYFVLSLFIGLVIVILSLALNSPIFRSAMYFGLASGITICLLSLAELYKMLFMRECPLCRKKVDISSERCPHCGFEMKKNNENNRKH